MNVGIIYKEEEYLSLYLGARYLPGAQILPGRPSPRPRRECRILLSLPSRPIPPRLLLGLSHP